MALLQIQGAPALCGRLEQHAFDVTARTGADVEDAATAPLRESVKNEFFACERRRPDEPQAVDREPALPAEDGEVLEAEVRAVAEVEKAVSSLWYAGPSGRIVIEMLSSR